MKVEYTNLYTHFIFTTLHRLPTILDEHRERLEKYITGIINNNHCKLYAIYANPEHVHFLVSRSPKMSEEKLADTIAESTFQFINEKIPKCAPLSTQIQTSYRLPFQQNSQGRYLSCLLEVHGTRKLHNCRDLINHC